MVQWRNLVISALNLAVRENVVFLIIWGTTNLLWFVRCLQNTVFLQGVHKSLRDFWPLRYSNRDGHAEGEHVSRGRNTPSFCPTLQCSICAPLVTRQMSNLAVLTNSKTQNASLFPVHAMFRHDCPLAVKPASTPRRLVPKKKKTWKGSLPNDMLLSAASVLVVGQPSSEVPEGLMNYPVNLARFYLQRCDTYVRFLLPVSHNGPWFCKATL